MTLDKIACQYMADELVKASVALEAAKGATGQTAFARIQEADLAIKSVQRKLSAVALGKKVI